MGRHIRRPQPRGRRYTRSSRVRTAAVVAVAAFAAVVAAGALAGVGLPGSRRGPLVQAESAAALRPSSASPPSDSAQRNPAGARWTKVLERLDARRSAAWSAARPVALGGVFAPDSDVLAADRRALARYIRRGLEVDGVCVRYRHVSIDDERSSLVRLHVVDRLGSVRITDRQGTTTTLPRDRPTAHVVVLVRTDAGWRFSSIRAA